MTKPNTAAEIVIQFGDSSEDGYLFALKFKQLEELERQCDDPIGVIAHRVLIGQCGVRDIYHTIRLGLIGGGMPPVTAQKTVDAYVSGQPLAKLGDPSSPLATAQAVMQAAWFGMDEIEHPPGEAEAATESA